MPQEEYKFALTETQQARLLTCRAAWDEGEDEERLQRLRQRAEDADTLRAVQQLLTETDFARGGLLNYGQSVRLLALVRALAPNPNLDSRLLRRPGEPEALNHDLRDLLFGSDSPAARLRGFLMRRHAGGQTALQLLCAVFPNHWPLVTQTGIRILEISVEQRRAALAAARIQFDLPPELPAADPVRRLLADVVIYEATRRCLQSSGAAADYATETNSDSNYIETHRLLTQGLADNLRQSRRFALNSERLANSAQAALRTEPPAFALREDAARYEAPTSASSLPFAPPVTDGIFHRDVLAHIENYVSAQGFTYPELTLRDYYIALQTKPFALISGVTGTGKTRLTSLFAEALTDSAVAQYRLLPVRPDWSDSAPLLGYVNLLAPGYPAGRYISAPFTEFLARATQPENTYRAYFVCLDELNLARVEHYFAEVLSAMETPTHELILPDGRAVWLPANLFISGTLNLDEATYSLSRKVLDRANLFTFDEVCLRDPAGGAARASGVGSAEETEATQNPKSKIQNLPTPFSAYQTLFLQQRVTTVAGARQRLATIAAGENFAEQIVELLASANAILQPQGLHFAYRVRDEVLRYCANSFDRDGSGLLVPETPEDFRANLGVALDLQLLQKVLPRFSGASEQIEAPLRELLAWAETEALPRTFRKITRMIARLQRDGFVSFDAV